jgi:hypothetical protein
MTSITVMKATTTAVDASRSLTIFSMCSTSEGEIAHVFA